MDIVANYKSRWVDAYTVERIRHSVDTILFGIWTRTNYQIVFEDTVILEVNDKGVADRICAACNGAYNLGREQERISHDSI